MIILLVIADLCAFAGFFVGAFSLLESWVRTQATTHDLQNQLDNLYAKRKSFHKQPQQGAGGAHLESLENSIRSIEKLLDEDIAEVRASAKKQFRLRLAFIVLCFFVVAASSYVLFETARKHVLPEKHDPRIIDMIGSFAGKNPDKTEIEPNKPMENTNAPTE